MPWVLGMRLGSELWVNQQRTMGMKQRHLELIDWSHVVLFLQVMKNDTYWKGTEVVLAWCTASGIPIGRYIK